MKQLSRQLKALANERRLRILVLLADKARNVGGIAELLKRSFRATSRHLLVLRNAGLVESEQRGKFVVYRLERTHPVFRCLAGLLS